MEIDNSLKRASLLSTEVAFHPENRGRRSVDELEKDAPPDKFYLAAAFAFFTGMAGIIPMTFFNTANDYWMYKLRDPQFDTYDLNNKTYLQTMFTSYNSIVSTVPSVISSFLTMKFAHRIAMRNRFLGSLSLTSSLFILFTMFVKINTDSWQTEFFVIVLTLLGTISFVSPMFGMSSLAFLSSFPRKYMKLNMFGMAAGGLFGSLLQLICLSIGSDSILVALIYFSSGTVVICATLLLSYLTKHSVVIEYYQNRVQKHEKPKYTIKEYLVVLKIIWPILVIMLITTITMGMTHPNVTVLIVSEGYNKDVDNLWYNKYFVVVVTFLAFDFFMLIGRFFSGPYITPKNYWIAILLACVRSFLFCPLYMFCNAQPRNHLPVWFPHDFEYMIIQTVGALTLSIFLTSVMLSLPNIAKEKTELAYMAFSTCQMISASALSPVNPIIVTLI